MRAALKWGGVPAVIAGAVYAGASLYAAGKITRRAPLLPQVAADTIAPRSEAVEFRSRNDEVRLRGWWFPSTGARALVLIHGHGQNRCDQNWGSDGIARAFLDRGYGVLMFDLRGHGESAASRQSYGVHEKNDVLGALDYLRGRGVTAGQIGMLGSSYGAATMLQAAPEMPEVGALVADSAFAEAWPVIAAEIPRQNRIVAAMRIGPGIRTITQLLYRINLLKARPIAAVERIAGRPLLFIHGASDAYVPPANSERMFAASSHPRSELWLVPGADHAETYRLAPEEFIQRVAAFLEAQLGEARLGGSGEGG